MQPLSEHIRLLTLPKKKHVNQLQAQKLRLCTTNLYGANQ